MKKITITFLITFLTLNITFSQNTCSTFYPFSEGTTFEMTNYSKKGKTTGYINYEIINVENNSSGETATISSEIKDEKKNIIAQSVYDIICNNDGVSIDFKSMVSPQMTQQFQSFDMDITGTNLYIPNHIKVGQELEDAQMDMAINMGVTMNFSYKVTQRKVTAKETVTTSAGTFDCFVIESTSIFEMGATRQGKTKQWLTKGVGMVKQEEYNNKGKLMSYSELTAFNK